MNFVKMQGLGNDYIVINLIKKNKLEDLKNISKLLSDRHFGIGGDGIIIIEESIYADYKMRIFNSDGSEAEMCGNGIRCVGKYLYDHGYTDKDVISIETKGGVKSLKLNIVNDKVESVMVDLGRPKFSDNGLIYDGNQFVDVYGKKYFFDYVSMGNPHAVIMVDDVSKIDVDRDGEIISNDYHFPNKTNVEFVQILNNSCIKMRVFERGSRETLACGTGASASVATTVKKNLTKRKVKVKLLGGDLMINFDKDNDHIYMTGPAKEVFRGNI